MDPQERPEAFLPTLVETPVEDRPDALISPSLQRLFTTLGPSSSLPFPDTNIPIRSIRGKVKLPPYIRENLIGPLRRALDRCYYTGLATIKGIRALHRHRDERYRALCPVEPNKLRFIAHTNSINRLREWKESFTSPGGFGPDGPAIAPSAKIPREVIQISYHREAYEEWAGHFNDALNMLRNERYRGYCIAKADFEEMLRVGKNYGNRYPGYVIEELEVHWRDNFVPEMLNWEEMIPRLELPSFEALVEEVFEAVIESVEGAEDDWEDLIVKGP